MEKYLTWRYQKNEITSAEIARILREIAALYTMEGVAFKPQAYEKAAMGIEEEEEQITEIYRKEGFKGLRKIPGVGQNIALHIEELIKTGKISKYEEMKKDIPADIAGLTQIPGVGPKTVKTLYEKLKIRTVKDLEVAAKTGKISRLPHFGKESERKILRGVIFHASASGRYPLGSVFSFGLNILTNLRNSDLFDKIEIAGSFRRRQETVGDLDMLAVAKDPIKGMSFFTSLPNVAQVLAHGETKSEIRLENGLQMDLRIVPGESWGAALQYFTGNKNHNIDLRNIAIKKGYKLNEYGVFEGEKQIAGKAEEDVYQFLGLDWVAPELRNSNGEIEAALNHELPEIIDYGDVIGDLQVQTNWTDGHDSIEEMVKEAQRLGRKYIAITDHTKYLAMTGGNDEERLQEQIKEIDQLNKNFKDIKILKGAEVNILKDGSLDIADEVLAKLDIVGVAVHSHFSLPREEQTGRIIKALSNPHVNIFFHPTTRIIGRREPIDFDFQKALEVARKNRVAFEINAHPARLDLKDDLIRQAIQAGVKLVINTDSHTLSELNFLHFGEAQARRGWATKSDVLNTLPVEELLKYFRE